MTEARSFIPVRIAVLTISNSRTLEDDVSGQTLADLIAGAGPERQEIGHDLVDPLCLAGPAEQARRHGVHANARVEGT